MKRCKTHVPKELKLDLVSNDRNPIYPYHALRFLFTFSRAQKKKKHRLFRPIACPPNPTDFPPQRLQDVNDSDTKLTGSSAVLKFRRHVRERLSTAYIRMYDSKGSFMATGARSRGDSTQQQITDNSRSAKEKRAKETQTKR